jgi:hypothetical protein
MMKLPTTHGSRLRPNGKLIDDEERASKVALGTAT